MSIKTNYKAYKNIFNTHSLEIEGSNKYLLKIKIYEIISKIALIITSSYILLILFILFQYGNKDAAPWIFFFIAIGCIVGFFIWNGFTHLKINNMAKLDNILFNNFLINKINIYYSMDELNNYTYDKIEHITTKLYNTINPNQTLIDLTSLSVEKGAQGIVITNKEQSSHTSGSMRRGGRGNIKTQIIDSSEAILIKNIQKQNQI